MQKDANEFVKIKILMIEDDDDDVLIIQEMLEEIKKTDFEFQVANRLEYGLLLLDNQDIDIVLLDLSLPDSSGFTNLNQVLAKAPQIPVIVLTGLFSIVNLMMAAKIKACRRR